MLSLLLVCMSLLHHSNSFLNAPKLVKILAPSKIEKHRLEYHGLDLRSTTDSSTDFQINGKQMGKQPSVTSTTTSKNFELNGQLTAYEILHPYMFTSNRTGSDIARPLEAVIKIFKKSLRKIIDNRKFIEDIISDYDQKSKNKMYQVLRIEHTISYSVDPLCWLHEQQERISKEEAMIYFANSKRTIEVSGVGAVHVHRKSSDDAKIWEFIEGIPPNSHVYGGERFDREMMPDEDWMDFGAGYWMLPAVELRRQGKKNGKKTTLAIHIVKRRSESKDEEHSWSDAAHVTLKSLEQLSHVTCDAVPTTTLPPVISRDATYGSELDSQEVFERGVTAALSTLVDKSTSLEKVVLARRSCLYFDKSAKFSALDVLRKWKFGGDEGGHLFLLRPDGSNQKEFFGCTPEQLFSVSDEKVITEALAGTRPRGSTQEADEALSRELFQSTKDRAENEITGRYIRTRLKEAADQGLIIENESLKTDKKVEDAYYVRRLLHLQHICQRFECKLEKEAQPSNLTRFLLSRLHPTPAVCGFPREEAMQFIRSKEGVAFDRGFYAGPFGFMGKNKAEITVALRCALLTNIQRENKAPQSKLSVFAGAGIVPGSTVQSEWAETSFKLNVASTLFPQSPISLSGAVTPNAAWATAFIEELIRCGVRQFYVSPGSRSTPLVAALAKALRANVGVVTAHSVHDERGAVFRAVGYGRACGRPAAVITSSGSATANLYPGIIEAGQDGIPMLILTADRPYENRDTGANQAVDQVKTYSSTYIRWFRDIPPPSDDVPVSAVLSDANHGVKTAIHHRGPVHLNIQFRENLAPDAGNIRNDDRVDSIIKFNSFRFTDVPNFYRWSNSGNQWMNTFDHHLSTKGDVISDSSLQIAKLIQQSKRGIIVTGNLRANPGQDMEAQLDAISDFATNIGFPVFAGVQSLGLRNSSPAVIPFAEHLLKSNLVSENIQPDLILQIGHPLISAEIPKMIQKAMRGAETMDSKDICSHVLIHDHHVQERIDPFYTITHRVSTNVAPFLSSVVHSLESFSDHNNIYSTHGSDLIPLISLGRYLGAKMQAFVDNASKKASEHLKNEGGDAISLTEPQVVFAMMELMKRKNSQLPIFISNSMPIRDAEFFLYPVNSGKGGFVGVNRGASGIDGIFSSAEGYAEGNEAHTMLLIGDLAALHDINSLHSLSKLQTKSTKRSPPVTAIVINNDGGGIFSFLPIAQHGNDVAFEEFFGTPTNSFSFESGAKAFGIKYESIKSEKDLVAAMESSFNRKESTLVEAFVVQRKVNVEVHRQITKQSNQFISSLLDDSIKEKIFPQHLPIKSFSSSELAPNNSIPDKTLLLLHGWMGDKTEWDKISLHLTQSLPPNWSIVAIDLCGHGEAPQLNQKIDKIMKALKLNKRENDPILGDPSSLGGCTIDSLANSVIHSLTQDYGIKKLNGIAGYSLGGRVAMAMNRLCQTESGNKVPRIVTNETKLILLGANPGPIPTSVDVANSQILKDIEEEQSKRKMIDNNLAKKIRSLSKRSDLMIQENSCQFELWDRFLDSWYEATIWGNLKTRNPKSYQEMVEKRSESLCKRADDIATVLEMCSPGRNFEPEWKFINPSNTLFFSGELDHKYTKIGKRWKDLQGDLHFVSVPKSGHAILNEAPRFTAEQINNFLTGKEDQMYQSSSYEEEFGMLEQKIKSVVEVPEIDVQQEQEENLRVSQNPKISKIPLAQLLGQHRPVALDFEPFSLDIIDPSRKEKGVVGIGWGEKGNLNHRVKQRKGFILQLASPDGLYVGIGEVSPLKGLHKETLLDTEGELKMLKDHLEAANNTPLIDTAAVLKLEGDLNEYINTFLRAIGIKSLSPSVYSGIEMALLSFASQVQRKTVLQCLSQYVSDSQIVPSISLNGLKTRSRTKSISQSSSTGRVISYSSIKVKVGHQDVDNDAQSLLLAREESKWLRADANRAWTQEEAFQFSSKIDALSSNLKNHIEFIEEPVNRVLGVWKLKEQLRVLENWYQQTGIKYGLDESIADLVDDYQGDFELISDDLINSFKGVKGCAAFVLKPALLGLELSMRLSRLAQRELEIGVVFSSSFDSGIGLSYTAFLAAASNMASGLPQKKLLAHGISTFSVLDGDTLSPSFGSYVDDQGLLQVVSLSRAFFGLGLDEMRGFLSSQLPEEQPSSRSSEYESSTTVSTSGKEITLVASLPLPFSDEVAFTRYADLPQQARWSPWLKSVTYLDAGRETEWTLNVRGVNFRWRAASTIIDKPYKGIQWESISGLRNLGIVEFVPSDDKTTCTIKMRMKFQVPRILAALFPGASTFLENFLQDKLIKWSLEMFRDIVKGDLALEKGDVELGDALYGAVEGKASAIEATLSVPTMDIDREE